jgi:DNA helicase-2/ATP-dependent DNA helicase PcrA
VPGSGKTHTLSALAANLIADGRLEPGQEILIVTLVNSAVDNFSARIAEFVQARGLLPQLGYRVRTLHGLAHDIVREDPPLVGLDKQFSIVDETASSAMIRAAVRAWNHTQPELQNAYLSSSLDGYQLRSARNKDWPDLAETLASSLIRSAKDRRLTPSSLRLAYERQPTSLPLLEMGLDIYSDYERALTYRGAVDFDDLVRLAAEMLESSPQLLERLRHRWPFILEDEAQDSSKLQQEIISTLAGDLGNWVRVGDPNQAIFETFTTADPALLREFIRDNQAVDMPESGRCQASIMGLANFLIDWTMEQHPVQAARDALSPPHIEPAPEGDPQPNPPDDPDGVILLEGKLTAEQEVKEVVLSLEEWLPSHQDQTVAVLSSTNDHAARVVRALQARGIDCRELLRSTSPTRAVAGALSHVLGSLADSESPAKLAQAYRVWRRDWRADPVRQRLSDHVAASLARIRNLEDVLAPTTPAIAKAWLQSAGPEAPVQPIDQNADRAEAVATELEAFRRLVGMWQGATVLPIDQLVLTISQDVFSDPADLALAYKLALVMRQIAEQNPQWRLAELTPTLIEIARNERRFLGFSSDDAGFDPDTYKGVVIVSTMHKAKGLEWDRVYLMSVNDYDFPSAQPNDRFISEKWFLRDGLNLEAEALAQFQAAVFGGEYDYYEEGVPTRLARLGYVRERLRLLYVGITRARRQLIVSWNTGRRGEARPALPLVALQAWWQSRHASRVAAPPH